MDSNNQIMKACQLLKDSLSLDIDEQLEQMQTDITHAAELIDGFLSGKSLQQCSAAEIDVLMQYLSLSQSVTSKLKSLRGQAHAELMQVINRSRIQDHYTSAA